MLLKSAKLLTGEQMNTESYAITKKFEEKEMDVYFGMVQLDALDSDKRIYENPAENDMVRTFCLCYTVKKILRVL